MKKLSLLLAVAVCLSLTVGCQSKTKQNINSTASKAPTSSMSNDPVYNQMMDPNTPLGKDYAGICKTQSELSKDLDAAESRLKSNESQAAIEKVALQKQLAILQEKLKTLKTGTAEYSSTKTDIDEIEIQLKTFYK